MSISGAASLRDAGRAAAHGTRVPLSSPVPYHGDVPGFDSLFPGYLLLLPRAKAADKRLVPMAPGVTAKLALPEALAGADISKSGLARRIGKDEKEICRILGPRRATKLQALSDGYGRSVSGWRRG